MVRVVISTRASAGTKRRGLAMPGFRQSGGPVAHENSGTYPLEGQLLMKTLAPTPAPTAPTPHLPTYPLPAAPTRGAGLGFRASPAHLIYPP